MPDKRPAGSCSMRRQRLYYIIGILLGCVIIAGLCLFIRHLDQIREQRKLEEMVRIKKEKLRIAEEEAERQSQEEIERIEMERIADSIRTANGPKYTISDVHKMVREKAPSYSWIHLWRMDNDNWIMQFVREYGGKEHWFMQRFNPTTRHFEEPLEFATVYRRNAYDDGVYSHPKNARCRIEENNLWGTLIYYEDGKEYRYNREGIQDDCRLPNLTQSPLTKKRIRELEAAPPDWKEEGYESAEDYFYDNAEDLYFYYGGK